MLVGGIAFINDLWLQFSSGKEPANETGGAVGVCKDQVRFCARCGKEAPSISAERPFCPYCGDDIFKATSLVPESQAQSSDGAQPQQDAPPADRLGPPADAAVGVRGRPLRHVPE